MKLSELSNDTMLTVSSGQYELIEVMSKEDYLSSSYFLYYPGELLTKVTVADITTMSFDIENIIETIGDGEVHEDWYDDVMNDIDQSSEVVKNFVDYVNKIFENNHTYWEGEPVEIDMVREVKE